MSAELDIIACTIAKLIELGTEKEPLIIKNGKHGAEFCIGKHVFIAGGTYVMPFEYVQAYAFFKMAIEVEKANPGAFKF